MKNITKKLKKRNCSPKVLTNSNENSSILVLDDETRPEFKTVKNCIINYKRKTDNKNLIDKFKNVTCRCNELMIDKTLRHKKRKVISNVFNL